MMCKARFQPFAVKLGIGLATVGFLCRAEAQRPSGVLVRDAQELRQAVAQARPGTRIRLAPGTYPGGFYLPNVRGEAERPIIIAAEDPKNPPVIQGGPEGINLAHAAYVELEHLVISRVEDNGLNISDGGSFRAPAHHIVLRGLKVTDIGPQGNHDGIKLSGVDDFRIEGCTIERWGIGGGSAIDMVGCHRGVIEGNLFRHDPSVDPQGSNGVQAKGGSSQVTVRRNRFQYAGDRMIHIGGCTDLRFFRPPLEPGAEHWEAKDIRVEGNTFVGSDTPVAFVGADRAVVRFNTIYCPKHWAIRILQETRAPGFVPCRYGEFTDNIVVFRRDEWWDGGVNVIPGTAPRTFTFARNWWHCLNDPAGTKRLVRLPASEADGVYGRDPQFRNAAKGDLRLTDSFYI
jgi:hypothetical protein